MDTGDNEQLLLHLLINTMSAALSPLHTRLRHTECSLQVRPAVGPRDLRTCQSPNSV